MDANQFLVEFRHIASAPSSIHLLRELIFQLAIQGTLVTTSTSAKQSSELIEAIADHIKMRVQMKEVRRPMPLSPISLSGQDFKIPNTWSFERLGSICEIVRGVTFSSSQKQSVANDNLVACLRTTNIQTEIDWNDLTYINAQLVKREDQWVCAGDIIISMANSYELVGKVALVKEVKQRTTFGGFLASIRPYLITPEYLFVVLRSPYMQSRMRNTASQTTNIANISLRGIRPILVPIPPIEDQELIAAKVNELMALCDKLEAQQQERETLCKITRKVALDNLVTVQTSDALAVAWNRVHDNFSLWLSDEDGITELRNTIGFLGCRGLLTEPNPCWATEPNKSNVSLPVGWSWETLGHLSEYITSGSRGWKRFIAPQGDIFIRSQDLKHDSLIFEDKAFVILPEQVEGMRTLVRPGDLLMTITGANVGKCAQVPKLRQKAYVSQHVALIRVLDARHTPFLHWWITNSFGARKYLAQYIYGDKPGLNLAQVRSIPIPLPPQEIQDRIVEALNHYSTLFERLAFQVREARNTAELLASASISSITGVQVEDNEKMKVPKTELVSTLRIGVSPANSERAPLAAILIRNNGEIPAKTLWQASGLEIDAFYQQLKLETARGWIVQPQLAYMKEVEAR
jgi:type I restriction enzyme, S subunit